MREKNIRERYRNTYPLSGTLSWVLLLRKQQAPLAFVWKANGNHAFYFIMLLAYVAVLWTKPFNIRSLGRHRRARRAVARVATKWRVVA
jgi:hypothetical protein